MNFMPFILILAIIIIDQVTKYAIVSNMELYESIPVIEGVFHITYTRNYGAAFSILQNQKTFFITVTTIVSIIIFYMIIRFYKKLDKVLLYSLSLIVAGAIGNLIDRIRLEHVTDFLDFRIWPIFNVADMSVVAGAILMAWYVFFIEPKKEKVKKDDQLG